MFLFRRQRYRSKKKQWVEDCAIAESAPAPGTSAVTYIAGSVSRKRIRLFRMGVVAVLGIFFLRLAQLQVVHGRSYRLEAEGNRKRRIPIAAERGQLFDRNGTQLTANIPEFGLSLRPADMPRNGRERQAGLARLAELTGRPATELEGVLSEYREYGFSSVLLLDDIPYETALSLLIAAGDLPGISVLRGSKRLYVNTELAHVIGYESKINPEELARLSDSGYIPSDTIGRTGIEKIYEKTLRGAFGWRTVEVNAAGKEQTILEEQPPTPGKHLRLTIDAKIQSALTQSVQNALTQNKKTRGAAIAVAPNTGEILALVSLPDFDNNDFSGGISSGAYRVYIDDPDQPLFNRAIAGAYPSGSTVKPAYAAGALAEGIIKADTAIVSAGGIRVGSWFFPDWLAGGHGITDVRKSLAWSVNTFYYYIGGGYNKFAGLGVERLIDILSQFGFGRQLGIDLSGESAGFVPSPEWKQKNKDQPWYIGDTYNLSIGQGDLQTTPLQIASMTAAIANGGVIYRPHLTEAIIDPLSGAAEAKQPEVISRVDAPPADLALVRMGMRDCVVYGSCRRLNSLPLAVAGKTGTAQWSSIKNPHAWFTSFAPFEKPEIALTILIEEGGEGSSAAVPAAEEFYRWWNKYRNESRPKY